MVNRAAMAELVHRALPPPVADKLTRCRSWPGLAKRLEAWQQQGLPVDAMLESLPVWGIKLHPRPAMYTTNLMSKSVDKQLADVPFAAYASALMTADHGGIPTTLAPDRTDPGSDQVSSAAEQPGIGDFDSPNAIDKPEHLTSAEEAGVDEQKAAKERTSATEERGEGSAAACDEATDMPDGNCVDRQNAPDGDAHECMWCLGAEVGV
jgi:hypothetical protein